MKSLTKKIVIAAGALVLAAAATVSVFAIKGSDEEVVSAKVPENFNAEPLSIVFVSPEGQVPSDVRYPEIQIQFSDPVVPLAKLGTQSDKCEYAEITPALSGYWKWIGTSTLSFVSRDAIIPQKYYTVKVNSSVKSIYGKGITGNLEYGFFTEKLRIIEVIPGYKRVQSGDYVGTSNVPLEQAKDIGLVFNTAVDVDEIKKFLTVTGGYSGAKTFVLKQVSDTTLEVLVNEKFTEEETVSIQLEPGARAKSDTMPLDESTGLSFETLKTFCLTDVYLNEWGSAEFSNPVYFYFSSQLKNGSEEEVAKLMTCSLPGYKITKDNINISGSRLVLHNLPVKFDEDLTVTLKAGLKDLYGRVFPEEVSRTIHIPPARGFANYKDYGFKILEAQYTPKIAFEYQNITKGHDQIRPLADAGGRDNSEDDSKSSDTYYDVDSIPKDTRVINAVDLTRYLTKAGDQYHGAIYFSSRIDYYYYYRHWRSNDYVRDTSYSTNDLYLQVTDLGLSVRYGYNEAAVLVSKLSTGEVVPNATVNVYTYTWRDSYSSILSRHSSPVASGVTDSSGLAVISLDSISDIGNKNIYVEAVTADKTDAVIFRADQTSMWRYGINTNSPSSHSQRVSFIFTDRGLYKPGEKVTFKFVNRILRNGNYSIPSGEHYTVSITDCSYYDSDEYYRDSGTFNSSGCGWGEFRLPEDIRPGKYRIRLSAGYSDDATYSETCYFQVQYFERLRFEVKTSVPDVDFYRGDTISVDLLAQYLGGGSMAGANYESSWTYEPCGFSLNDNRYSKMIFGPRQDYDGRTSLGYSDGVLGGNGKTSLTQKTGGERINGMAYKYRVNVDVSDFGNQAISSSKTVTVHPAKYYIGIESLLKGGYPKKGSEVSFNYVCVDPHGDAPGAGLLPPNRKDALTVELLREDWKLVQQVSWDGQINTRYVDELVSESKATYTLSGKNTPERISVKPAKGGRYLIRFSSYDSNGNEVITEKYFYVTGGDWYWYSRQNTSEISLTTDKSEYEVGETAQILLQSPIEKGTYMVTIEREGIWSEKVIKINEPTTVIEIPVEERFLPLAYVTVSSYTVRKGKPTHDYNSIDLDKPKGCFGVTEIHVSRKTVSFDLKIQPNKTNYKPGEKAVVKVIATKNGRPVPDADITLMGVDRGVIDLVNYHVPNPSDFFYDEGLFPLRVYGGDSRSLLIDPVTYEIKNLVGGDADDAKITERKNFDPTAVFIPSLITNEKGEATCTFTWPDTLTAYRLTAVGVSGNTYSIKEDEVSVANPVSVRQVLPRKLRLNDQSDLGVVVSNLDPIDYSVNISLAIKDGVDGTPAERDSLGVKRQPGHAEIAGSAAKDITATANTTKPLMFRVDAKAPGWITLEFTVKSPVVNERIVLPLEIEKPYIYEAVASIGRVEDDDAKEMIQIPIAEDGFGDFYIQLDPTRLGALRESVNYVFKYPYGCMEQRSSKVLPLIAFGDYLDVFDLKREVVDAVEVAANEIRSWESVQKRDGGFPYWPDGKQSNAYVSARIGEILGLAKLKGIDLGTSIDTEDLSYYIVNNLNDSWVSSKAYSLYAANLLGRSIPTDVLDNLEKSKEADVPALCFIALVHHREGRDLQFNRVMKKIRNRITLTPRGADIQGLGEYSWWGCSNSDYYAAALQLFSEVDPKDEINDHLVFELLKLLGKKGYWYSTSSTTRALIAIDAFIRGRNLKSLDFTATAFLNGKELAQGSFKGVAAQPVSKTLEFSQIKDCIGKDVPLSFKKKGTGDLYYTMAMRYAIPPEKQLPVDEGISLFVEVYDSKTGELVTDGVLEEGKVYREKVYVSTTKDLEYVAVRAPVPAGCEILNAAFVTTSDVSRNDSYSYEDDYYGYYYRWYRFVSHRDIYDSEVQYFWDSFYRGNTSVEFSFRATRTGQYSTPCATAECMYEEEIFGRSAGKIWTIK